MKLLSIVILFSLSSCIQNQIRKLKNEPDMRVTCYSDGRIIYSGIARSSITHEKVSDYFVDDNGKVIVVRASCVFLEEEKKQDIIKI